MPRSLLDWLVLGWAALLLLPWYAIDGGTLAAHPTPAVLQALADGRVWLLPLALPLLAASWAARAPRHAVALIAAAIAGLVWQAIESAAIIHHGWAFPWLAALTGSPGPVQPALGWGGAAYALSCTMLLAFGLARRGALKGDVFILGAILLIVGLITLFVFYPIVCVLASAVRDEAGHLALPQFFAKLASPSIWSLGCIVNGHACGTVWNTVAEATLVGVLSTALGLAFALVASRTHVPMKPLLRALSILPIITPPFVIGLALILLFGRAGIVTVWLAEHAGLPRSRWIYGMPGITIAQVLAFTPIAYMVLAGVLQGVAPSLEEASLTLRASRWYSFRTVTWLVEEAIIVELKTVQQLNSAHRAQCLNYLRATDMHLCLLMNFGRPRLEVRRIVHDL